MGHRAPPKPTVGGVAEKLAATSYGRLAKAIGTTPSFLSRLFRGQRTPTMDTALKLCHEMGVTLEELYQYINSRRRGLGKRKAHQGRQREKVA